MTAGYMVMTAISLIVIVMIMIKAISILTEIKMREIQQTRGYKFKKLP